MDSSIRIRGSLARKIDGPSPGMDSLRQKILEISPGMDRSEKKIDGAIHTGDQ